MADFRAESRAEVCTRYFRVSASVMVSVSVEEEPAPRRPFRRRAVRSDRLPLGLREPGVRWDVLPPRILPDDWTTGQADAGVPGSLLGAEGERGPDGYYSSGG
jgi:hypothetical protein